MQFTDTRVFSAERFSVGVEETTTTYFVSIPVSNGFVAYEEYYSVPKEWVVDAESHLIDLRSFVETARRQEVDDCLILKPGSNRGVAI